MFSKLFALLCLIIVILVVVVKKPSPSVLKVLSNPIFQIIFLFIIYIKSHSDMQFGVMMAIVFVLITNRTSMEKFKETFADIAGPYLPQYFQKITDKFESYAYEHHKCDELNGFERADCLSGIIKKVNKQYS